MKKKTRWHKSKLSQARREVLEEFGEYCHTRYKGTYHNSEDGWRYAYDGEVVTMLEDFLDQPKHKSKPVISKTETTKWWRKPFDKKFTRKSRGLEDKGKYMDRWFVRETTAKELKDFIDDVASRVKREERIKTLKWFQKKLKIVRLNMVGYSSLDGSGDVSELLDKIEHKLK